MTEQDKRKLHTRIKELKEDIRVYTEMIFNPQYKDNNIGKAYRIMRDSKIKEFKKYEALILNDIPPESQY